MHKSPEELAPLCTPEAVVKMADLQVRESMSVLSKQSLDLHERGYHSYSAAVGNMRSKIEKALNELVDEVMPEEHVSRESR